MTTQHQNLQTQNLAPCMAILRLWYRKLKFKSHLQRKIINQNLTKEQSDLMVDEATDGLLVIGRSRDVFSTLFPRTAPLLLTFVMSARTMLSCFVARCNHIWVDRRLIVRRYFDRDDGVDVTLSLELDVLLEVPKMLRNRWNIDGSLAGAPRNGKQQVPEKWFTTFNLTRLHFNHQHVLYNLANSEYLTASCDSESLLNSVRIFDGIRRFVFF